MNHKGDEFYKKAKLNRLFTAIVSFVVVVAFFSLFMSNGFKMTRAVWIVYFLGISAMVASALWSNKFWKSVHHLFFEACDLDAYYTFFKKFLPKSKRNGLWFYFGLVEYCRGHFEESGRALVRVRETDLLRVGRKSGVQNIYIFLLLNAVGSGDEETFDQTLSTAIERKIPQIELIGQLLRLYLQVACGEVVKQLTPLGNNKLFHLINTYYCAKNALNAGDVDQAREFFESIKDENPELFMVQEARAYLEE